MKTSSFFIVAVIVGILIESIITRYDVSNLNQQKKNITVKSRINEDDSYRSLAIMEIRTFHILRHQYPQCNLAGAPNHVVETVVGNFEDPPQLLGWNIIIQRNQANFITCCNFLNNPAGVLHLASLECLSGGIRRIRMTPMALNCGLVKILVRLCMNADYNGYSLHSPHFYENRAMQYIRGRMYLSADHMHTAYTLLHSQVDAICEKIMMINMHVAPNTREWRETPGIFFDSAQHAMYDSIAYEYIDDTDNLPKIDPSYYPYFASLAEQAYHFDYDQNEAEFDRDNGAIRKRVVGPRSSWYLCSTQRYAEE